LSSKYHSESKVSVSVGDKTFEWTAEVLKVMAERYNGARA